ncbi:MAG: HAMP domain-containing sensor histidine kinase [Bacillota bacterium]|nr:HAMP domain-containing sensor histidine kinase [Bacillota bacterium]
MKNYFTNTEIKISSAALIFMMIIFLSASSFMMKINNDNLKEGYIKQMGAVALRVIEKNPDLEKDIMPLMTKNVDNEEAAKGEAFMKQYGLSKDLQDSFFPYAGQNIINNITALAVIFLTMLVVMFILNYIQYAYFYKRIRRLTLGAERVVEGDYDISISENKEGDLSKLSNSFNSMRKVIRNNISELKKEKQFLADLLSDISHQLKTPLSSLILYNDIMLSKELTKQQTETFLISNKNQLFRMNWLIRNILKLAKLDAKAIELNKENQSLNETIEESIYTIESKANESNIKINFNEKEEIEFCHDRLWLEEALNNIIKNGIEHTQSGGEINIYLEEKPVYKRIIIEDNGEGISEDDLPNIFKRFYKAKTSKKTDSIGIGLALSKSIIELHDGIIEVQSKLGEGARFIITFL